MTTSDNNDNKLWQLNAITEALGDLEINVENKLTVGRGQDNDLVLGSKQVSRQHAELTVDNNVLLVEDLGSSNGTLVNDQKLEPNQPTKLSSEDVITFAAFSFKVSQAAKVQSIAAAPATEPKAAEEIVTEEIVTEEKATKIEPESKVVESNTEDEKPAVDKKPTTEPKAATQEPVNPKSAAENAKHNAEAVERANIDDMSKAELEQELEQELEEPISRGDPNQKQAVGNTEEYYEELAAEADPEVHRSKQAASAQMSATTELHEQVDESKVEQSKGAGSNPVASDAPVTTDNLEKTKASETTNTTKATHTTQTTPVAEKPKQPFNTVNEQQDHKVAHINNSATQPTSNQTRGGKNKPFMWMALLLVGLAIILWLYNSGSLA